MRRTASEVIRNLEGRIARLEKQAEGIQEFTKKNGTTVKISGDATKGLRFHIQHQWETHKKQTHWNRGTLLDNVQMRDVTLTFKDIHIDPKVYCLFNNNYLSRTDDDVSIVFSGKVFYIDEEGFEDNQSFEGLIHVEDEIFYEWAESRLTLPEDFVLLNELDPKDYFNAYTVSQAIKLAIKNRAEVFLDEK